MQDINERYRKIRKTHPFMPAKHALSWAKSRSQREQWEPDGEAYVREHDGYTLRLTYNVESIYPEQDKHGNTDYGRYVDEVSIYSNHDWNGNYPEPREDAPLGLPYTSIRYSGPGWVQGEGTGYFIPNGIEGMFKSYREHGQSKAVAWDLTKQWCEDQLKMLFSSPLEHVVVTLTASKGPVSADASMGTEIAGDTEGRDYLFEMADELLEDVIADLEGMIETVKKF